MFPAKTDTLILEIYTVQVERLKLYLVKTSFGLSVTMTHLLGQGVSENTEQYIKYDYFSVLNGS